MIFKRYKMKLKLKGPLHIGSGSQKGTKEYIFGNGKVYFPDMGKVIENIEAAGLFNRFSAYISQENTTITLIDWLKENKIELKGLAQYHISYKSTEARPTAIDEYTKDGNGDYYIPGSSIKGMLRTIIERKAGQVKEKEQFTFWNKLSVADSPVIARENAIICGKVFKQGPIFRECIKPGVEVEIDIVVKSEEIDRSLPKSSAELAEGMPYNLGKGGGNQSKSLKIRSGFGNENNESQLPKAVEIDGEKYYFGDIEWVLEEVKGR